jgi:hypothetical protein
MTMPRPILDDPDHWHRRAKEARAVAEQLSDPESKAAMLRIAGDYKQIAEQAQRRATRGDRENRVAAPAKS